MPSEHRSERHVAAMETRRQSCEKRKTHYKKKRSVRGSQQASASNFLATLSLNRAASSQTCLWGLARPHREALFSSRSRPRFTRSGLKRGPVNSSQWGMALTLGPVEFVLLLSSHLLVQRLQHWLIRQLERHPETPSTNLEGSLAPPLERLFLRSRCACRCLPAQRPAKDEFRNGR